MERRASNGLRIFLAAFGGGFGLVLGMGLGLFALWEIGDLLWGWSGRGSDNPWEMIRTLAALLGRG